MRELKLKNFFCYQLLYCVISLPMRNWKPQCPVDIPGRPRRLLAYLWGIEEPAIQLPGCSLSWLLAYLNEELKRWGGAPDAEKVYVISLPMRNWNLGSGNPLHAAPGGVISLPMRNWNRPGAEAPGKFKSRVISLPMRNWNFHRHLPTL